MNSILSKLYGFLEKVKAYYPTYLAAHTKRGTKIAHIAGNIMTLVFIAHVLNLTFSQSILNVVWLGLAPFVVYPFAWLSHLLIEKNKPATFTVNPLITKACDIKMILDVIRGKVKL